MTQAFWSDRETFLEFQNKVMFENKLILLKSQKSYIRRKYVLVIKTLPL
jgi:hypothetical protein